MIDDLKRLFSQTWEAFRTERSRREPEDQVAELLGAMRREMVDVRAMLPEYEEAHRGAGLELERERRGLEETTRRRDMAERIGDAETVRVAEEFAARHRGRVAVLEQKVQAARAEADLRRAEAEEMTRRYKEADLNRFALLAEIRRAQAQGTLRSGLGAAPGSPTDEFDRMAGRMGDDQRYQEALHDLDADLSGAPPPPPPPKPNDVEARLAELKRRMSEG